MTNTWTFLKVKKNSSNWFYGKDSHNNAEWNTFLQQSFLPNTFSTIQCSYQIFFFFPYQIGLGQHINHTYIFWFRKIKNSKNTRINFFLWKWYRYLELHDTNGLVLHFRVLLGLEVPRPWHKENCLTLFA